MKIDARLMFLFATFALVFSFMKESASLAFVSIVSFLAASFHHLVDDALHRKQPKPTHDADILKILQVINELEVKHRTLASKIENLEIKSTLGL